MWPGTLARGIRAAGRLRPIHFPAWGLSRPRRFGFATGFHLSTRLSVTLKSAFGPRLTFAPRFGRRAGSLVLLPAALSRQRRSRRFASCPQEFALHLQTHAHLQQALAFCSQMFALRLQSVGFDIASIAFGSALIELWSPAHIRGQRLT